MDLFSPHLRHVGLNIDPRRPLRHRLGRRLTRQRRGRSFQHDEPAARLRRRLPVRDVTIPPTAGVRIRIMREEPDSELLRFMISLLQVWRHGRADQGGRDGRQRARPQEAPRGGLGLGRVSVKALNRMDALVEHHRTLTGSDANAMQPYNWKACWVLEAKECIPWMKLDWEGGGNIFCISPSKYQLKLFFICYLLWRCATGKLWYFINVSLLLSTIHFCSSGAFY